MSNNIDTQFLKLRNTEPKPTPKKQKTLLLEDINNLSSFKVWLSKGLSIEEACTMAGISYKAYSNYVKRYPEQKEHLDLIRKKPNISAKVNIHDAIVYDNNLELSKWVLERTESDTYGTKVQNSNKNETELKIEFNKWTPEENDISQTGGQNNK